MYRSRYTMLAFVGCAGSLLAALRSPESVARGDVGGQMKAEFAQEPKVPPFIQRLLANGFKYGDRGGDLIRRFVPLKEVCRILKCKPTDFEHPNAFLVPAGDVYMGPWYRLKTEEFECLMWMTDPRHDRNEIENATVHVAVLPPPNLPRPHGPTAER